MLILCSIEIPSTANCRVHSDRLLAELTFDFPIASNANQHNTAAYMDSGVNILFSVSVQRFLKIKNSQGIESEMHVAFITNFNLCAVPCSYQHIPPCRLTTAHTLGAGARVHDHVHSLLVGGTQTGHSYRLVICVTYMCVITVR